VYEERGRLTTEGVELTEIPPSADILELEKQGMVTVRLAVFGSGVTL
jgi:hypothetical protein